MSRSGFYRAEVVNANDPDRRRRVRLRIPSVFGNEVTGWAEPMMTVLVPREGSRVWATFEGGDESYPLHLGPRAASMFPATVESVSGASVRVTVPSIFGGEVTEWVEPAISATVPEPSDTVWVVVQADFDLAVRPGRGQLVYFNPSA